MVLAGIIGLGGFGKSTLAAKVYQESDAPRKFWADISAGTDFSELARKVLIAWGMEADQVAAIIDQNLVAAVVQQMQAQAGLLVIDNLETVLTATGEWQSPIYQEFMQRWIEGGTQSKLLLTSRERPELAARRTKWYGLEQGLEPGEGATLLRQLGVLGEAAELEAVSDRVGGYPLSLVLIAGWLADEEPHDPQVRYLSDRGNLFELRGLHRGQKQISVAAIFDWSFDRLSPKLQQLLTQISVYRGAFNLPAAAALMPYIEVAEQDLRQLVRRSLLQELPNHDRHNQRQFRLQPQVQTWVQQKSDDLMIAHQWAIEYYRTIAQPRPWNVLENIYEYLEICHHYCELRQFEQASMALEVLYQLLYDWGNYTTLIDIYQRLAKEWQTINHREQEQLGWIWIRLGLSYRLLGEIQQSLKSYQQARQIFEELASHSQFYLRHFASALDAIGGAYRFIGQYSQSISFFEQAKEIARHHGDQHFESMFLQNLGTAYREFEQPTQAVECYQRALEIARSNSNHQEESVALQNLGLICCSEQQYSQAIQLLQEALNIAHQHKKCQTAANALMNLGFAYVQIRRYQRAMRLYQLCLKIMQQLAKRRGEAKALKGIGKVHHLLGNHTQAVELHEQVIEIVQEIGDRQSEAYVLGDLAEIHCHTANYSQALKLYQQSLGIARKIGDRPAEANALFCLGFVFEKLHRTSEAVAAYQQASTLYDSMELKGKVQLCETALRQLAQPPSHKPISRKRNILQRAISWLWHMYQTLWLRLQRWFRQ